MVPRAAGRAGNGDRTPRTPGTPRVGGDGHPRFSLKYADREYCCTWSEPHAAAEVLGFLRDISASTWGELRAQQTGGRERHRRHHEQDFESVCSDAQSRLLAGGHNERFSELFRFRVTGEKRLWGFEADGTFYLLWWDPHHQVYPLEPPR